MSDNVYAYIKREMEMSLGGPPDTDFQRGYLAGLMVLAEDVLGLRMDVPPFSLARKLCGVSTGRMNRYAVISSEEEELAGEQS